MAKLIYSAITSLDGYVADAKGDFSWAMPDEELHRFVNDAERPVGTYLYGRRMYETMVAWEDPRLADGEPEPIRDFQQIWKAADKIVYSRTLESASSARTRIEREFDAGAVRRLKASAGRDLSIGGPHLAAEALRCGLVDEVRMYLAPVAVGSGNPAFADGVRIPLELLDERRFGNGTVLVHYRIAE